MDNKKYPTKIHEILGLEEAKWYDVTGYRHFSQIQINDLGWPLVRVSEGFENEYYEMSGNMLSELIQHPDRIIRKPHLSPEQKDALLALYKWCASKWLLVYDDGILTASSATNKPKMGTDGWDGVEAYLKVQLPHNSVLRELVIDGDTEPLNIVAVLKDTGVEITATTTYNSK